MKKTLPQKLKMNGDIPSPRFGHSFTMVSKTKAVLFGGAVSVSGKFVITNQTFLFDFLTSTWKKLNFQNNLIPSQRAAHSATCVADMQMVLYGGASSNTQKLLKDQLYLLDLRNQPVWRVVDVVPKNNTPGQRYGHSMVYNKPHLIIFGGNSGNKVENDVWFINFQKGPFSWTKYEFQNGRMPCPRVYHSAALCQQGKATGMMVVFGGRRQSKKDHNGSQRDINASALNDIWGLVKHRNGVWDWNTPPISQNFTPTCRYQHLVCFIGSKLVIMGGRTNNPEQSVNTIQAYDTETAEWERINSVGRYRHTIAVQGGAKIFIHGGFEPEFVSQPLDTLVSIDLSFLLSSTVLEDSKRQNSAKMGSQRRIQFADQSQSNLMTAPGFAGSNNPTNRAGMLGLREVQQSERNISNNSRIKSGMGKSKHQRDLTPSRIINSSKNTRLSNQVVVAKGDILGLQFEKVHVNSLMEESKKLNNQDYEDSSCSGVFDQRLQQLTDQVLMMLMPMNGQFNVMNSSMFPLKKEKIYRLCYQTSKILVAESSLIGIRTPVKIFGSIYGQHSQLLRFFQNFGYPDEREMETFEYVFLGNYVDKGFNSLETLCTLMALKIKYPEHIHLLRGKHQDINVNRICGLGEQCETRLGQNINDFQSVFQVLNSMFDLMPLAAAVEDKFLLMNGRNMGNVEGLVDIKNISRPVKVTENRVIMELLWSGHNDVLLAGYKSTKLSDQEVQRFLDQNGLDMIINTKDGLINGIEQNKYELSLFSVSNYGNKNNKGCVLKINKNFQVMPQILKPIQSTKNVQWINENKPRISLNLTENESIFRKAIFQA